MSATTPSDEIRFIETGDGYSRFARGWHCLGLADDFRDGKPHELKIFGQTAVVFAGEDGEIHMLDAFCRHMGGNLAHGEIKGNEIACPFHDWRWNGEGRCTKVPYARRTPLRARTLRWITMEKNGLLFCWNDPQGNPPPADVTIPEIPDYDAGKWTAWSWKSYLVEGAHCREIVDNVVDMAHFFYVHYQIPRYFKNVFEGHVASQYMNSTGREDIKTGVQMDLPDAVTRSEASYFGPSFMLDTIWTEADEQVIEAKLVNCHYPISENSFLLQYGIIVEKLPGMSDEDAQAMGQTFVDGLEVQFLQDVEVWKHKTRIENPLLTEEDGPVYQLRRWYQQFYVDVEDVTPDMTKRFEFEVDCDYAVETWEAESRVESSSTATAGA
ncbi:Rieske 2Fe-2S domain-containing protein [Nocardioides sp. zg-DK7169]|uniref:Rieske 2Fe-2S domain-containing protein n=1 Tax=Nocardioides sp. zg-DK7169 TaxID=2736600 RepID=UPI001557EE5B|nr:Rieske 2Fe-2S domain-containing protein [Nocardioides sp. zg-DK7169]NPC98292.1 aromatic ring-hydroxylating dioxygenase subunit alpha [Nocardioides sp. zg-DK7169]